MGWWIWEWECADKIWYPIESPVIGRKSQIEGVVESRAVLRGNSGSRMESGRNRMSESLIM